MLAPGQITASPWVARFAPLIRPGGAALDVACGGGRHAVLLAELGHDVVAVDRDLGGLPAHGRIEAVQADLEAGPWPLPGRRFDAVIVTNYLHRPLFPALLESLADDGLLLYETFAVGNERFGRPSNPDFLLRPGELLDVCKGTLRVLAYEDGIENESRAVQRIAATKGQRSWPLPG